MGTQSRGQRSEVSGQRKACRWCEGKIRFDRRTRFAGDHWNRLVVDDAIAQSFAFTLIPIALGYHLAHYLVFFLVQGQYIVPLLSDPFGYGWNLLGTARYRPNIAIVGARFAWYTAIAAVLLGHIAAVYLAHLQAMQTFATHKLALASQIPLTALMVVYTFVSLSILAEPIVERRQPSAQPSTVAENMIAIPADAVLPDLDSGRLQAMK